MRMVADQWAVLASTASVPAVAEHLVGGRIWRLSPSQTVAIDEETPAWDASVIDPWLAMGLRKAGAPDAPSAHRSARRDRTDHGSFFAR